MNVAKIVGLSFLITAAAFADIGQTEAQIETKYGKPIGGVVSTPHIPGISRAYNFTGYSITVTLLNGISVMETFSKNEPERMRVDDVITLLSLYSPGHRWKYPPNQSTNAEWRHWVRDDEHLEADFSVSYSTVSISTPEFNTAIGQAYKKEN
jgi:hypothetical protein